MKRNLYYAFLQVFKLRGVNLVKLLSLTLGIVISGALMCRVAYEQSYDNFHPQVERLNVLYMHWNINGKDHGFQRQCYAEMAPELKSNTPNVTAATRYQGCAPSWFVKDNEPVSLRIAEVDTSFFDVIQLPILSGNAKQTLSKPEGMLLSQKAAQRLYPQGDYMGKQIDRGEKRYIVEGVFEDLPANTHLDVMDGVIAGSFRPGWDGGDNSYTYFRTSDDATPEELTAVVNKLYAPRFTDTEKEGIAIDFKVENIRTVFREVCQDMDLIMSLLALLTILVAGFNFALLSISSLTTRAKEVGVHKTSGARSSSIFAMIMWESVIYVVLSLILSALIIFAAQPVFESMLGKYEDIMVLQNMWAVGVVLLGMLLVGGVLPAVLFARIPVTQVFRRFTATKARWKIALLFIQFASTIFVLCFLSVIVGQYNTIMTHDLGYKYDKLVHIKLSDFDHQQRTLISNELNSMSIVQGLTYSSNLIPNSGGGYPVFDMVGDQQLFSADLMQIDSSYIQLHDLKLIVGTAMPRNIGYDSTSTFKQVADVIVNEQFLKRMGKNTAQLTEFKMFNEVYHICGVVRDFQTSSLRAQIEPMIMTALHERNTYTYLTVELQELNSENIAAVRDRISKLMPTRGFEIGSYSDTIKWQYQDMEMFRDGVIMASIVLLIISLMGIVGYVSNEIKRRSREIAVRKIYGSSSQGVVILLMRNIMILVAIASAVAIPLSYIICESWQSEYQLKMPLHWWIFVSSALVVVVIVSACVTAQTWHIATTNPSKSLKAD